MKTHNLFPENNTISAYGDNLEDFQYNEKHPHYAGDNGIHQQAGYYATADVNIRGDAQTDGYKISGDTISLRGEHKASLDCAGDVLDVSGYQIVGDVYNMEWKQHTVEGGDDRISLRPIITTTHTG